MNHSRAVMAMSNLRDLSLIDFVGMEENEQPVPDPEDPVSVFALVCGVAALRLEEVEEAMRSREKTKRARRRVPNPGYRDLFKQFRDDADAVKKKKGSSGEEVFSPKPISVSPPSRPRKVRKARGCSKPAMDDAGVGSLNSFLPRQGTDDKPECSSKGKNPMEYSHLWSMGASKSLMGEAGVGSSSSFLAPQGTDDKPECSSKGKNPMEYSHLWSMGASKSLRGEAGVGSSSSFLAPQGTDDKPECSRKRENMVTDDPSVSPNLSSITSSKSFMGDAIRSMKLLAPQVSEDKPDGKGKNKLTDDQMGSPNLSCTRSSKPLMWDAIRSVKFLAPEVTKDEPESTQRGKRKSPEKANKMPRLPRPAANRGPELPPGLPEDLKQRIEQMGGRDPILVIQKGLFATDVSKHHNRLSIPLSGIKIQFLTDAEKAIVNSKDAKGHWNPINLNISDPTGMDQPINFKKWDMPKGKKEAKTSTYNLTAPWHRIVVANGWVQGVVIQLWAFRVDGKLAMVIVRVEEENQ